MKSEAFQTSIYRLNDKVKKDDVTFMVKTHHVETEEIKQRVRKHDLNAEGLESIFGNTGLLSTSERVFLSMKAGTDHEHCCV